MATYEWVLTTPKAKEYAYEETTAYEVEEPVSKDGGLPVMTRVQKSFTTEVVKVGPANIARLSHVHNDLAHHRLFVRFFYGRMEDGKFKAAKLDDGVVFSGPTYIEHEFHEDPTTLEEVELLNKIAAVLRWDGAMKKI